MINWIQPVIVHPSKDEKSYHTERSSSTNENPMDGLIFFSLLFLTVFVFWIGIKIINRPPKNKQRYKIIEVDENYGTGFGMSFYRDEPEKRWAVSKYIDSFIGWSSVRSSTYTYRLFNSEKAARDWIEKQTDKEL